MEAKLVKLSALLQVRAELPEKSKRLWLIRFCQRAYGLDECEEERRLIRRKAGQR